MRSWSRSSGGNEDIVCTPERPPAAMNIGREAKDMPPPDDIHESLIMTGNCNQSKESRIVGLMEPEASGGV